MKELFGEKEEKNFCSASYFCNAGFDLRTAGEKKSANKEYLSIMVEKIQRKRGLIPPLY